MTKKLDNDSREKARTAMGNLLGMYLEADE